MDDGYIDQAEIAAPIFLEYNCPLTFFVITGMLDQEMWPWDAQVSWIVETTEKQSLVTGVTGKPLTFKLHNKENRRIARRAIQDAFREKSARLLPQMLEDLLRDAELTLPAHAPSAYKPMNWDLARKLENEGIRFGPHSVAHHIFSRLDKNALEQEINSSWKTMEKELKNPLKVFCYPSGRDIDFGIREIITLENTDFLGAVSTIPGFVEPGHDQDDHLFNLPRLALPDSMDDFIQYCTWIEYVKGARKLR
jgi:peptidoglycan/xylan/chitin deacetylase (PgdA/CDA1 family)